MQYLKLLIDKYSLKYYYDPMKYSISIVVPIFNEKDNVKNLVAEIEGVFKNSPSTVELILVDDGSTDGTREILKEISAEYDWIKVIIFTRNYGQTAAMSAGFKLAAGDVIVSMDGDLQNDPNDIKSVVDKINEGYDIVNGWRKNRHDPISKTIPSMLANALIRKITDVRLHDFGCTLKAYRPSVIKNIQLYGEMHRFIPAVASWMGVQVCEIPVNHRPRTKGKSKYGLGRVGRVILDLVLVKFLVQYASKPLQVFGKWGFYSFFFSVITFIIMIFSKFVYGIDVTGSPWLYMTILFVLIGVQFISMGLISEMNVRIYFESLKKEPYVIKTILDKTNAGT